ncbi:MAG: Rrf2 family transcriptional regulator [Dehalococcoidales bacterium]|nr:Rrf2 family transcriptional regulator [Dehalococcoidales bacterium]
MKLSTKGRYAMRAMLDLSVHYGEGLVLLKDVASRQEISERYLEHLFLSLKAAGLVNSTRGANGGFVLSRPPAEIKLMEVMAVSEGQMSLVECVDDPGVCNRASRCATRDVWVELKNALEGVLEAVTLQDMVMRQRSKEAQSAEMYNI